MQGGNFTIPVSIFRALRKIFELADEGTGQPFHGVLPLLQDIILFEALEAGATG